MSRRRKKQPKPEKVKRSRSPYLHDEYSAIQEHFEEQERQQPKRKKGKNMLKLPPVILGTGTSASNWHNQGNHHSHMHAGDKIVWESTDGKKLYAGNGRGVNECSGAWDLIIDVGRNINRIRSDGFIMPLSAERFESLRKYTPPIRQVKSELLQLDWNDMSVPPCSLSFWQALWDMLPEKTLAMCVGGHGRTGTCLAALMIASGEMTYYNAVKHVRDNHCDRAIENLRQEEYLHTLYVKLLEQCIEYWNTEGKDDPDAVSYAQNAAEDLDYAKKHVPWSGDSYGERPVVPVKQEVKGPSRATKSSTPLAEFKPSSDELKLSGTDRYKLVGEYIYKLSCRMPHCFLGDKCTEGPHLGWALCEFLEDEAQRLN